MSERLVERQRTQRRQRRLHGLGARWHDISGKISGEMTLATKREIGSDQQNIKMWRNRKGKLRAPQVPWGQ